MTNQSVSTGMSMSWNQDKNVGLTPTGVQRHETESQARLILHPDRERQPTDGCGALSHCSYKKGGKGLGAYTTKFAVTYLPLPHHPRTDH
jgi:hypothetical protein